MKNNFLKIILLGLLASNGAMAEDLCTVIGFHEPGTHTYDGPTFCEKVSINGIIVRGPLETNQSVITGTTDVSGPIDASHSQFNKIISENNGSIEKITLKKNSIIKNDITFEGNKPGIVEIDESSSVGGKVVNGKITRI